MSYNRVEMYETNDGHIHIYYYEDGGDSNDMIYNARYMPGFNDDTFIAASDYATLADNGYENFWESDNLDINDERDLWIATMVCDCNNTTIDILQSFDTDCLGVAGKMVYNDLLNHYAERHPDADISEYEID